MYFELLSQMEFIRHQKEETLRSSGLNASLILLGILLIITSIFLLFIIGLAVLSLNQAPTTETSDTSFIPMCTSVTALFGAIGLFVILAGAMRRRKINRDIEAAEVEFQHLHNEVIAALENRAL